MTNSSEDVLKASRIYAESVIAQIELEAMKQANKDREYYREPHMYHKEEFEILRNKLYNEVLKIRMGIK